MASQAEHPLVYIVFSLHCDGNPSSPRVEGVYTKRDGAIEIARSVFEGKAKNYRGGEFVSQPKHAGSGQEDDSRTEVALTERSPGRRLLLEVIGDDMGDSVAVSVNAARLNKSEPQSIPMLSGGAATSLAESAATENPLVESPDSDLLVKGMDVRVVMWAEKVDYEEDASLLGVFSSKESAVVAAREQLASLGNKYKWSESELDPRAKMAARASKEQENELEDVGDAGCLFRDEHQEHFAIAMDTVPLGAEANLDEKRGGIDRNEMLSPMGCSGLWMNPRIDYDEIEVGVDEDSSEESCDGPSANEHEKQKRSVVENEEKQRPPTKKQKVSGTANGTQVNSSNGSKTCTDCQLSKTRADFSKTQWKKGKRRCKACVEAGQKYM